MSSKPDRDRAARPVSASAGPRSFLGRREATKMALLVGVTAVFVVLMLDFLFSDNQNQPEPLDRIPDEVVQPPLPTMPLAELEDLPPLPSPAEMAARAEDLAELEQDLATSLAYLPPTGPLVMVWLRQQLERDRAEPPVPLGRGPEELARNQIMPGTAILVSGEVVEIVDRRLPETDEDWLSIQMLLPSEEGRVLTVIHAPAWAARAGPQALSVGRELRVLGRYLGTGEVPTVDPDIGSATYPTIGAYSLVHASEAEVTTLLGLGADDEHRVRRWRHDPSIFFRISDYPSNPRMSHLEQRPYYYLLGQAALDRSTPGVYDDATYMPEVSREVWEHPEEHRGEVFTVEGRIYAVWEDRQVARDHPFGVRRVLRMWLGTTIFTFGQKPFRDLYEVAVIVPESAAVPEVGESVRVTGRFLKVLMYYDPKSPMHRMVAPDKPDNDRTLFKFIVAPDYEVIPPLEKPDYRWLKIIALAVMASFLVCMTVLIVLEDRSRDYRQAARRLRSGRRRMPGGEDQTGTPAADEAEASSASPDEESDQPR